MITSVKHLRARTGLSRSTQCVTPNKQLQRTVRDKVPRHLGQHAAAELRR